MTEEFTPSIIAVAEALNQARLMANANEETAPQMGIYGQIETVLLSTLELYFRDRYSWMPEEWFQACAAEILAYVLNNGEDIQYNLIYFDRVGFTLTRPLPQVSK